MQTQTEQAERITVSLLNRRIDFIPIPNLIAEIKKACRNNEKLFIASCNVHSFNLSMQLPWFYDYLSNADIIRCDGMGILKAVNYCGLDMSFEYKASGTNLVPILLEETQSDNFSYFLLGSKQHTLETALENMREMYPGIKIAGHHGYFDKHDPLECDRVLQQINQMRPDILIVGMGMPIQEDWIHSHRDRIEACVVLPCGAIIDRLAGDVPSAPTFVSRMGLEWLYRLLKEPRRLAARYLLGNPAFLCHLLLYKSYTSPLEFWKGTSPTKWY